MSDDHPRTVDGIADEDEAELRRLVAERGADWSLTVDPEAGGGCLVEIRRGRAVMLSKWARDRIRAVTMALNAVSAGNLDRPGLP